MKQEKIRYSYSFFDKFGIQFKIPNSNDLVLRNRDTQQLILMKDIQVTPAQYEQTLATLDYQKKLSHEQLLGLLDYHAQPTIHKFIVLYEYCHISLMEQFQNRLAQRRYFQQPQLWSIFTSLVFGLAYLQEKNVGHGSISLIDCFLNQQGFIKISDPTCATSNPYNIVKGYYYGPQILRCLIQQTTEQINIFKSDMFALGCCMLQLSLMRQITDVIDYENGVINKVQLKGLLSDLAGLGLTKQYVSFLNQSLILDSHKRPDFITLKAQIFYLLSLGNTEQSQQLMRQSYGIKSSLSSLCRSKGEKSLKQIAKKDIELLENKKIQKVNFTLEGLLQTTADKNRQPLAQMQRSNEKNLIDFTFFGEKPNVDYIFGNMKKSITLQKQPQYNLPTEQKKRQKKQQKQNMVLNRTHILNNQYTYKQQKTCKSHRKPMQDTLYFQQNIEFGAQKNKKRRQSQLPYRGFNKQSCHSITIEKGICQKALIIRKQIQQLFSQSPLNTTKQSYLQQKTMYSSQIKKSTFNSLQNDQMYTDPSFLQMMRADVEQILHKRMNLF